MNINSYFLILFSSVLLFFIGYEDWMMLIPVPLGIINGWINSRAIIRDKFGKAWHTVQFLILTGGLVALKWTNLLLWDEILLVSSLYYISFEVSLNLFRGLFWAYVGRTAATDVFIRTFLFTMVNFKTWVKNGFISLGNLFRRKDDSLYHFNKTYSEGQLRTLFVTSKLLILFAGVAIYLFNKPL